MNSSNNGDLSDNSAVSIGNNSFGFNFDSEECNPSPVNSDADTKSDEDNGTPSKDDAADSVKQNNDQMAITMQNTPTVGGNGVGTVGSSAAAASKVSQMQRIAAQCFPTMNSSRSTHVMQGLKMGSSKSLVSGSRALPTRGADRAFLLFPKI